MLQFTSCTGDFILTRYLPESESCNTAKITISVMQYNLLNRARDGVKSKRVFV